MRTEHEWTTRTLAVPAPLLACRLLVRCSDAAPRRPAVRMPVVPTTTTTPPRQPITPLLSRLFRTCLPTPLPDLVFLPWRRAPLLHPTDPLRLLLRPIPRSRKKLLAPKRLHPTSLRPGRWTSMRIMMTSPTRRRRLVPQQRAVPTVTAPNRPMAMELPATVARVRLQRLSLRRKKVKNLGSLCNESHLLGTTLKPLFSSVFSNSLPLRDVRYECVSYVGLTRLARGPGEVLYSFSLCCVMISSLSFPCDFFSMH